jgi:hypothetical protein
VYLSVLPELPKLISGNDNHYPNLGSGTSGSGNSGSGLGNLGTSNGYRVFCPGLGVPGLPYTNAFGSAASSD